MKTKNQLLLSLLAVYSTATLATAEPEKKDTPPPEKKVQLAILLDTSSSMSGLIDQAKTQLWKIVNTFNDAKKNGQAPFVEVALYEYGNSRLNSSEHWIKQIQPLTRDLDLISEQLFSLHTNGGEEYCGAVISRSLADLKWDPSNDTYKAIFIAGNEPFTQGPITPDSACKSAQKKGVIINTIHCGGEQSGISGGWQKGAQLAGGSFLTIDQNKAVVHIDAPQDKLIIDLNIQLNKTYVPYGSSGTSKLESQTRVDSLAEKNKKSGAHLQRAITKASKNYHNASWDLCDATTEKNFDWSKVKKSNLPKELQKLSQDELKAHVKKQQAQRKNIQTEIQTLNKEREAYVAKKRAELAKQTGEDNTLDQVIQNTIRQQATKKGYSFN